MQILSGYEESPGQLKFFHDKNNAQQRHSIELDKNCRPTLKELARTFLDNATAMMSRSTNQTKTNCCKGDVCTTYQALEEHPYALARSRHRQE